MARPLPSDIITADVLSDRVVLAGPPSMTAEIARLAAWISHADVRIDLDPQVEIVTSPNGRKRQIWKRASGEVMTREEVDAYLRGSRTCGRVMADDIFDPDPDLETARIRLECLKVAAFDADRLNDSSEAILARAHLFADFVFGTSPTEAGADA